MTAKHGTAKHDATAEHATAERATAVRGAAGEQCAVAAGKRVVLVVDDDDTHRNALARAFERRGFDVLAASSAAEALALSAHTAPSFASVDLRMPGASGLELVRQLKDHYPATIVVVLTGYGSIATAVEAVKLGAADYLTKPADANDLARAFGLAAGLDGMSGNGGGRSTVSGDSVTGAGSARSGVTVEHELDAEEVPSLARVEWEHISRVLADCGGNVSRAARLLRMQRRSLQRKLAKYPVSK